MENIYGWFPTRWKVGRLDFEFVDWITKEVDEIFIEDEEMLSELKEIQSKCDDFYNKYLK